LDFQLPTTSLLRIVLPTIQSRRILPATACMVNANPHHGPTEHIDKSE